MGSIERYCRHTPPYILLQRYPPTVGQTGSTICLPCWRVGCSLKNRIGPNTCGQGTTGPNKDVVVACSGNESLITTMRQQAGAVTAAGHGTRGE
jgi:hypothetical protein